MKTVFVVERVLGDREILVNCLKNLNFKVVVFQPAEKFVDQLIKSDADIIFINEEHYFLRQPILRLYLQMHPNLQIVLSSDSAIPASILDEYRCKYAIEKPYNFNTVSSVLHSLPLFVPKINSLELVRVI